MGIRASCARGRSAVPGSWRRCLRRSRSDFLNSGLERESRISSSQISLEVEGVGWGSIGVCLGELISQV